MLTPPKFIGSDRCSPLEMRIVWNLIHHLIKEGFEIFMVDEGEEVRTTDPVVAMEAIFSVDDSYLYMGKPGFKKHHILIVLGNGTDCVCDYSYYADDRDRFDKVMQAFDEQEYV